MHRFITLLSQHFSIKDLGRLTYFLGVEVTSYLYDLILSQCRYITNLSTRTCMTNAKLVATPLVVAPMLDLHSNTTLSYPFEYWTIVGSLQYLLLTQLDITYAINKLSQFMHCPIRDHWNVVKRLLWYLCGTLLMVFSSIDTFLYHSMLFFMLIEQTTKLIVHLPMLILFTQVAILALRVRRNNGQLPTQQKLNIDQLLLLLQNSIGFAHFSLNLEFYCLFLL